MYRFAQCGGPDGEIGASMRYLSQRFAMPNRTAAAVLNDVGSEASEMAHVEGKLPLKRQHIQIHVNVVFVPHYHFVK